MLWRVKNTALGTGIPKCVSEQTEMWISKKKKRNVDINTSRESLY